MRPTRSVVRPATRDEVVSKVAESEESDDRASDAEDSAEFALLRPRSENNESRRTESDSEEEQNGAPAQAILWRDLFFSADQAASEGASTPFRS